MNKKKGKKAVRTTRSVGLVKEKKPAKKAVSAKPRLVISNPDNKSGVQPLGDRVLLRPLSPEEAGKTTSFGIIIPETIDKEKPEQGTVIAVGPGKRDENGRVQPVGVSVGDKVMFSKYGYDELKVDGIEYYIVSENNILAIIK